MLLERSSQALTMVIRDNGIGFDRDEVRSGASVGLSGMEERVQLVGERSALNQLRPWARRFVRTFRMVSRPKALRTHWYEQNRGIAG